MYSQTLAFEDFVYKNFISIFVQFKMVRTKSVQNFYKKKSCQTELYKNRFDCILKVTCSCIYVTFQKIINGKIVVCKYCVMANFAVLKVNICQQISDVR